MDNFKIRQEFELLLTKMIAQHSHYKGIQDYMLSHQENNNDLFQCILDAILNAHFFKRVHYFYLLDYCCAMDKDSNLIERELAVKIQLWIYNNFSTIVEGLLPDVEWGKINLFNIKKTIAIWKAKKIFDPQQIERMLQLIQTREFKSERRIIINKEEMVRKMEEDRERNKWYKQGNSNKLALEHSDTEFEELMNNDLIDIETLLKECEMEHANYVLNGL